MGRPRFARTASLYRCDPGQDRRQCPSPAIGGSRLIGAPNVEEARRLNPKATQEEVARAAGVSRPTVSRIERGDRRGAGRLFTPRA